MFCVKCHCSHTKVTNSRPHKKRASIWRRRSCDACGALFTTIETASTEGLLTVTDADVRSPFSVIRLTMSIAPLLSQRASAPDDAYWLAMTTYEKILSPQRDDISASDLASTAFGVIERFDSTAALKYALDHRLTKLPGSRARRPKRP